MKELLLPAIPKNLYAVMEFVGITLKEYRCPEEIAIQVQVAVEEIFVNIANYAYFPAIGSATVRCIVSREPLSVVISFLDSGRPYNPLERNDPDTSLPVEGRPIGGLGVYIVKKSMDSVAYEYIDGQNVLTIKKKIGP